MLEHGHAFERRRRYMNAPSHPNCWKTAVSPVLAALLLIMVTVSAAIIIYVYMQSQLPGTTETGPASFAEYRMTIEQVSWEKARALRITVSNPTSSSLSDYPVFIKLKSTNFNDWESLEAGNIYFVSNITTMEPLDYWVQKIDKPNRAALLWVKVPSIPASGTTYVYMIYNVTRNPHETRNNPNNLFYFYDGAEDGTDGTKWGTQNGSGEVFYSSSCAFNGNLGLYKTTAGDPNGAYKSLGLTLYRASEDIAVEFHVKRLLPVPYAAADRIGLIDNVGRGYGWIFWHRPSYYLGIDKRSSNSAVGSVIASVNAADVTNDWQRGVFYILGDGRLISYREYGTLVDVVTTTETTYTVFNNVYIYGGYDYCVDDIIVRKTAYPEPSAAPATSYVNITSIKLYVKNLGEATLDLTKLYVKDLETKRVIGMGDYSVRVAPGDVVEISYWLEEESSGFLEVLVTTEQGAKARYLLQIRD